MKFLTSPSRLLIGTLLPVAVLFSVRGEAANLSLPQAPLFLTTGVAPNIIVTLDNSNSMKWGFVPDSLGYANNNLRATRRVKSSTFNPMYYNPNLKYEVPKKVTFNSGTVTITEYSVSNSVTFDFRKVYVNGYNPSLGTLDLSSDYRVAWEYDTSRGQDKVFADNRYATNYGGSTGTIYYLAENPAIDFRGWPTDNTKQGVPAYYYIYNQASNCTTTNDNCYSKVDVSSTSGPGRTDERQNFAIWYAFYRNRALATQTATNLAFANFSESIRLTWQDLSNCTTLNSTTCRGISYNGSNKLRTFTGQARANFFTWLGDINYNTGTPLRSALDRAGRFLQTTGSDAPYAYDPGSTQSPEYACRPSYHIMMTDGKWNSDNFSVGNVDSNSATLPDGTVYTPRAPFIDSAANTLADLAFKYWATDAQPNISNKLSPYIRESNNDAKAQYWNPKNDPANWQHLVNYTLGLGLSESLTNPKWDGDTYSGGYSGLLAGNLQWPAASSDSDNNVYDLWHTAINSRGEFFSVESPDALVTAMQNIVSRISEAETASAGQALSSPFQESNSTSLYTYTPSFSSQDWSGDLIKSSRSNTTSSKVWSAQALLNTTYGLGNINYAKRKVYIASPSNTNKLQDFSWGNLSSAQQTSLNMTLSGKDSNGQLRVNYLRGDRTYESPTKAPSFRVRKHILGDIINSTPVLVGAPSGSTALMNATVVNSDGSASASYTAYKTKWASRAARIYVGANDGMLHAFDDSGNEQFAFIPSAVIGNLYKLSDPSYNNSAHQYYVDGSPTASDVYFDGAWHTVLVGSLRGGGRSLFALDITDPNNPVLLWEKSSSDIDYADLGFTYSKPQIARLHDGNWAVIVANGYNSVNDKAVLYLMNIKDGSKLAALTASGSNATNGLSSPFVADVNGDLIADYVYAGDLQGNMWRFDLIGAQGLLGTATASDFKVAFGNAPLFKATAGTYATGATNLTQPITASPYLVKHPSGTGHIVIFGTGKYIEDIDSSANATKAMSIYGIWDRQTSGVASSTPTVSRSNLQAQNFSQSVKITYISASGDSVESQASTLSNNTVKWYDPTTNKTGLYGYYIDFPLTGEMVVNRPSLAGGTAIVTSLVPNADPCSQGVTTWLNTFDPYTGGASNTLELGTSTKYSRIFLEGLISGPSTSTLGTLINISGTTTDDSGVKKSVSLTSKNNRRQSWRSIPVEE
ncbi:pilus assembly protein PilY [Pseudomonas luteola]|uniref:pilus assembly protein n=1 Tax=Pseudomonas luteola TaxID=47886 RepID=UPI001EF680BC|nr:PilC/PilY family type IV pilus protein [Pseudomonas luteola]MCG7372585.1 pilus assembly protein PilY [Pseudomonas luteola]